MSSYRPERAERSAGSRNSPYSRSARDDDSRLRDARPDREGVSRGGASMFFPRDRSLDNEVKPTGKLTVENIHHDISQEEIRQLFEQIGPVVKAYLKYDRAGRSLGTAVVIYYDPNHAIAAKAEYDGAKAKGQVIHITQEMRADRREDASTNNKPLLSRFDLSSRLNIKQPSLGDRLGPVRSTRGRGSSLTPIRQQQTRRNPTRRPVTAADLDAELDAITNPQSASVAPKDVDMA